jgi:phage I-like protein
VESTAQVVSGNAGWKLPKCERAVVLSARIVPDGQGDVGRLHVALTGHWENGPNGLAFDITEEHIDSVIAEFNAQATPVQLDYNHASVRGLSAEDGKAAGWIKQLSKVVTAKGAELWADEVEWTDEASRRIKAGEYAFCSPVLLFNQRRRTDGEKVPARLLNVALTNIPFLDGLTPVRLSEVAAADDEDAEAVPAPEGEAPAADAPAEAEAVPAAEPVAEAAPEAEAPEQGTQDGDKPAAGDEAPAAVSLVDDLARLVGVDSATVIDLMRRHADGFVKAIGETLDRERQAASNQGAAISMSEQAPNDADLRVKEIEAKRNEARVLELSQRLEAVERENVARAEAEANRAKAALEARVDADIASGRVPDAERADAIFVLSQRPEAYDRLYAKRPSLTETQASTESPVDPKTVALSALDQETRLAAIACMGIVNGVTGKKLSEREAIERAVTNIATFKARKAG